LGLPTGALSVSYRLVYQVLCEPFSVQMKSSLIFAFTYNQHNLKSKFVKKRLVDS